MAALLALASAPLVCPAKDTISFLKQKERNSVSLELEFSAKKRGALERLTTLFEPQPNAYATGFFVRDRLVITAYHVVSGNLDIGKRLVLGFGRDEDLEVKIFINGCRVKVINVDKEADLALLEVCRPLQKEALSFQPTVEKDERVLLIAKPQREKIVGYGTFWGAYAFNGINYWSIKMNARDGFSGSPVYNSRGEIIGVFSGYDWTQKLALVSPGERAQKLLEGFVPTSKP